MRQAPPLPSLRLRVSPAPALAITEDRTSSTTVQTNSATSYLASTEAQNTVDDIGTTLLSEPGTSTTGVYATSDVLTSRAVEANSVTSEIPQTTEDSPIIVSTANVPTTARQEGSTSIPESMTDGTTQDFTTAAILTSSAPTTSPAAIPTTVPASEFPTTNALEELATTQIASTGQRTSATEVGSTVTAEVDLETTIVNEELSDLATTQSPPISVFATVATTENMQQTTIASSSTSDQRTPELATAQLLTTSKIENELTSTIEPPTIPLTVTDTTNTKGSTVSVDGSPTSPTLAETTTDPETTQLLTTLQAASDNGEIESTAEQAATSKTATTNGNLLSSTAIDQPLAASQTASETSITSVIATVAPTQGTGDATSAIEGSTLKSEITNAESSSALETTEIGLQNSLTTTATNAVTFSEATTSEILISTGVSNADTIAPTRSTFTTVGTIDPVTLTYPVSSSPASISMETSPSIPTSPLSSSDSAPTFEPDLTTTQTSLWNTASDAETPLPASTSVLTTEARDSTERASTVRTSESVTGSTFLTTGNSAELINNTTATSAIQAKVDSTETTTDLDQSTQRVTTQSNAYQTTRVESIVEETDSPSTNDLQSTQTISAASAQETTINLGSSETTLPYESTFQNFATPTAPIEARTVSTTSEISKDNGTVTSSTVTSPITTSSATSPIIAIGSVTTNYGSPALSAEQPTSSNREVFSVSDEPQTTTGFPDESLNLGTVTTPNSSSAESETVPIVVLSTSGQGVVSDISSAYPSTTSPSADLNEATLGTVTTQETTDTAVQPTATVLSDVSDATSATFSQQQVTATVAPQLESFSSTAQPQDTNTATDSTPAVINQQSSTDDNTFSTFGPSQNTDVSAETTSISLTQNTISTDSTTDTSTVQASATSSLASTTPITSTVGVTPPSPSSTSSFEETSTSYSSQPEESFTATKSTLNSTENNITTSEEPPNDVTDTNSPQTTLPGVITDISGTTKTARTMVSSSKQDDTSILSTPTTATELSETQTFSTAPWATACPASRTGSDATGYINWPMTENGGIAISSCPTPTTKDATRKCTSGRWEEPETSTCETLSFTSRELQELARSTVVSANASRVATQILDVTENETNQLVAYDIENVANVLLKIVDVTGTEANYAVSNDVIQSVSNVIEAPSEEIKAAALEFSANSKLVDVVEKVLLKLEVMPDEDYTYMETKNIKLGLSAISSETFTGLSFALSSSLQPVISDGGEAPTTSASISIPPSILNAVPPDSATRVQFAVYSSTALFDHARTDPGATARWKRKSNFTVYSDYVISASVGDAKLSNLGENITITLPKSNSYYGIGPYCVFYQFPADGGEGSWSSDGCLLRENTSDKVVCDCNHLTNFAAIMDVYGTVEYLDEYQQMILRILTYIGCSLSIFGLLCTLISYTIFEKIRKEAPAKILICLCTALIAVNVVYLCLQSAYYSTPTTCVAVAVIMHYSLLSSLAWMGLEAINMYIALVKVFNTYYRKYMLKMSLVGWGVPLLIVLIAFIVQFATGQPSYEMNSKTEICWLRREVFYGTLVAPFGIVFLLNTVIYCLVLAQLLGVSSRKLKHLDSARKMRRPAKRENARKLRGAVGLMALLGISWGFALGTIDKAALTFAYVFVVFNSSQGFWVFIFHCVLKKDVSKSWKKLLFDKGKGFREGSSRWSRFSSSNTRSGSRTTSITSTARSMSTTSIKTSYLVPKPSRSVRKSEASIGMDSKGLDVVTRTNSSGYENPVFDDPDIGDPPPFPPPPVPGTEKRIVRKVPRRRSSGPSTTIATQTDVNFLESRDTDSQNSIESDMNSRLSQASHNNINEDDERRDSVDDNIGPRGFHHPFHREVALTPSNESGIYSDGSVSSTAPLVDALRFVGVENEDTMTSLNINSDIAGGNDVTNNDISSNPSSVLPQNTGITMDTSRQRFAIVEFTQPKSACPLVEDPHTTDSGISIASDTTSNESPSSSRTQNGRHKLQAQDSRSSLYSNNSNSSSVGAPSSGSETTTNNSKTPPSPHLWKAPLVIKRSEDPGSVNIGDGIFQRKPVSTSPQGAAKRTLWKKNRKFAQSLDETDLRTKDLNLSPNKRKFRRKLPKSHSLDEEGSSQISDDVKMTDFSINRGSFHDGAL